jgi:hypothetical protein
MRIRGVTNGIVRTGMAALVSVAGATAQDRGTAFGLKGGVDSASFHGSGDLDTGDAQIPPERRTGLVGGAFLAIAAGRSVLIQPEVLLTQKGARYARGGDELAYDIDSLEVPLLLKVRLGGGSVRGALFGGPAAGFTLGSRVVARSGGREERSNDTSEQLRSVDWGLAFGGGVDIAAGSGTLTLEARYTLGLAPLVRDPEPGETRSSFVPKSGVASLLLGYAFSLPGDSAARSAGREAHQEGRRRRSGPAKACAVKDWPGR